MEINLRRDTIVTIIFSVLFVLAVVGSQITGFLVSKSTKTVVLIIDNGESSTRYRVEISLNETAFDALKRVAIVDYKVEEGKIYISEINGLKEKGGKTWSCFVNDTQVENCEKFVPSEGDEIRFTYR